MYAKIILRFIGGETVDYATKKVERWYREEYGATAESFKFLEKDVDMVLDMVYQYHAQVMVAQNLLSEPLAVNSDYLSVCVRVPKRGELEDVSELIREVEGMYEVSTGLRTQVRARVINYIETAEVDLAAFRREQAEQEAKGTDFDLLQYTSRAISRASRARDRFRASKIMIERTGNQIDEQIAEALTLLENVRETLRNSQDGFAVIIKECNLWKNNWNRWDYTPGLGAQ